MDMKKFILILFLFQSLLTFSQVGPPDLNCAAVNADGSITLTWQQPADPSSQFVSYEILEYDFILNSSNVLGSLANYNATTFTDITSDGNTIPGCFFIQTNYNNGGIQTSTSSDTLCSIFLTANPAVVPGNVNLTWNSPFLFSDNTDNTQALIFVENPLGTWTQIATQTDNGGSNNYIYEVTACSAQLNFQIQMLDPSGCYISSNVDGGVFQDEVDPLPPTITAVDVDSLLGNAVINWEPSPAPDIAGYIIYLCNGNLTLPIDTIYDPSALSYMVITSNANITIESYTIAGFDDCYINGQPDPGPATSCQSTILLNANWAQCQSFVNLNWNAPFGWVNPVGVYDIFMQETTQGGVVQAPMLLSTVAGNVNTYQHSNATLGSSYRYTVRATSDVTQYECTSNLLVQTLFYPSSPTDTYLISATVVDRTQINILVDLDASIVIPHNYYLERKETGESDLFYEDIAIQTAAGVPNISFSDFDVITTEVSYTYRIRIENICNDPVGTSNIGRTMLLSGIANTQRLVNTIFWTEYGDWLGDVSHYNIYRSENPGDPGVLLTSMPDGVTFFEDDVSQFLFTPGEFCYIVEAVQDNNPLGYNGISFSNEFCLTQPPKIWVPNAFMVHGFNTIFKPIISFADFDNYKFIVMSKWGDVIFTSTDIDLGWDGTMNGELVPEGVYAWYLSVYDGSGRIYEERGSVTMLIADPE
jgi:hypothetical protein